MPGRNPILRPRRRPPALSRLLEPLESRLLLTTYTSAVFSQFSGDGIHGTGFQPDGLVMAPSGDLYGVSGLGGAHGYGVIFKIDAGTNAVIPLASFDGTDGIIPRGGLVVDAQGDVFGATASGGAHGVGTLFEYSATAGKIITLVSFDRLDGAYPQAGVVADAQGNLYGTTVGVESNIPNRALVFEWVASAGTLTTLATFSTSAGLAGSLTVDADGDVFGTTRVGGKDNLGRIFEIPANAGSVTTVASFDGFNGQYPHGGLVLDDSGDIFGTTDTGTNQPYGIVFEWSATSSALTRLAALPSVTGSQPVGKLVIDANGNLFGVTAFGGGDGFGSIFEVSPGATASTLTRLHAFYSLGTGEHPTGPLVIDSAGNIFVPTYSGGYGNFGTIHELIPSSEAQAPIKIVISGTPRSATAGHTLSGDITVKIEDIHGKVVTGDNDVLTLQIASGPTIGSLTGTFTIAAVNGTAVFNDVSLPIAGNYTLDVTDGTRTSKPTGHFTISPDASSPTAVFDQLPDNATHGKFIKPAILVKIEDEFGNVITVDHPKVSLAIATGPNGGKITGTQTLTASNGVAAFTDLTFNLPGAYTLAATVGTLTPITSASFTLT